MPNRNFANNAQAGDDYLLIDYGVGAFDLNHRYRVTALKKALSEAKGDITFATGLTSMVGCGNCKSPIRCLPNQSTVY
jgi:hypothetical protein